MRSIMRNFLLIGILGFLISSVLALAGFQAASAHEHRQVGQYQLTVGFLSEPAIVDELNGLELRVSRAGDSGESNQQGESQHHGQGEPVTGLEQTLQVEVQTDSHTKRLVLQPRFGEPGTYQALFIPAIEGQYKFHIFGSIEGTPVDEWFQSGPETFSDVHPRSEMMFPAEVSSLATLEHDLQVARDLATRAQILALAGIAIGVTGVGLAIVGFVRQQRTPAVKPEGRGA